MQTFLSTDGGQDVAEIIRDDLYKKPIQYYLQDEEDEEYEDGDGEGDEDESADDEEE